MEYSLLGFKVGHLFPAIKQVIDVTIHDIRQAVANLFGRPVPPFQRFKFPYHFFIETLPYRSGWNTADYRIGRYVFRNNGTCGYDCSIADVNASHNHRLVTYPYIVAYHDVTFVVPSRCNI